MISIKKLVVGLMMVAVVFGAYGVSQVNAITASDVEMLCVVLNCTPAQRATMLSLSTGGSSTGGMVTSAPVPPLQMQSSGAEVTKLQNFLISEGFPIAAGATGYFGDQTKNALMAFQTANNISPAVGYYGSITAGVVSNMIAMTPPPFVPPPFTSGPCSGGAMFNSVTGARCSMPLPAGCTSTAGFSVTTGMSCMGSSVPPPTLPAGCTSTAGFSVTTGMSCAGTPDTTPDDDDTGLTGGAGSVSEYQLITSLNNEEVGEDAEDVEIAGLEIEADNSSDIELTAVRLVFGNDDTTNSSATADDNFDEYVSEVSVWFNGEEVARMDGDEFDDDNDWTKTLTLDSGAVIKAGETADLVVAISAVSNLDSTFVGESWDVDFRSIRFVDGLGASTSEDPSTGVRLFSFESFATSAGAELKISADDESINDPHILDVHATDETQSEDVELLSFTLEAKGDSDLKIKKFAVDIDVTGAANVDDIIVGGATPAIKLIIDGEEYGTPTYGGNGGGAYAAGTTGVGADEAVRWADVDYTLAAGDTVTAMIVADLLAVDTALDVGDTIAVNISESETAQVTFVEVEDSTGENLVDADITGVASAGAHGVHDVFIDVSLVSVKETPLPDDDADDNDIVTFEMVFDITAKDGTVYIGDTSTATTVADGSMGTGATTDAIVYRVYDSGTATTDDLDDLITFTTPSGVTDSTDNIQIDEGYTTRVSMTVKQTNNDASDDGIYYLDLAAIYWGIADDTTYEFLYDFDLDNFKTGTETIN
ncbi:MAG: peptidoglycan-binding domain-containing protein [Patescibacteria group bacterium]